ncbi:MAG TPA: tRNA 2-selenouridine(34) synthase MnmH [Chitinophagaceae bacterium]|nr:tRNA 2-selenouridine(34) synthase MnmH [Chitinophagaceae bacterium]
MPIEKIDISKFLSMTGIPVIDVRSPAEFEHARIPGAYSLPLFSNEERAIVGTAYKQQSREQAIKLGLDFFGVKMRRMVEEAETLLKEKENKQVVVHCWRGGMRSAGVAWLLDLYGFKVFTILGGYKAYRHWVLDFLKKDHDLHILGGYTGSGKTEVLHHLKDLGNSVVDLEGLAHHKGSAFGAIGQPKQPSQEMFENLLALSLFNEEKKGEPVWLEDESQRMGLLNLPQDFWVTMRAKTNHFIDVPFENRLGYIVTHYGKLPKAELAAAIMRIQKRLGGLETKTALNFLAEDNLKECFRILLHYYDKLYSKALQNRPATTPVINIEATDPGELTTARLIMTFKQTENA